jgi:hypothetical protein
MRQAYVARRPGRRRTILAAETGGPVAERGAKRVLRRGPERFEEIELTGSRRPTREAASALAADIVTVLGEPPGRVEVVPDDGSMAWLVREGRRLSWFNLWAAEREGGPRRSEMVRAFADLVRRIDEQRPVIERLEVGRPYMVQYRNEELFRNFRLKAVLRSVSEFGHARGIAGAGWTLTLETKPRLFPASTFTVHTSTVVQIEAL